jgi:hypothetical protein
VLCRKALFLACLFVPCFLSLVLMTFELPC